MSTPTPETDGQYKEYARRDNNAKCVSIDFARKLERERDEIQNELNKCATQLVSTINDRNFIGVQLDLIRDEMLRIAARIRESGFEKHPNLSSILDYCERAQKDISVNYTPIQERDAWKAKASQLELDRDAWKAKAERTCKWSTREWSEFCQTECGERFQIPRQDKYKCCPSCGGRIIKEEK